MLLRFNNKEVLASVSLPRSKSISNRLLILNEVLGIHSLIEDLSDSKDTTLLIQALQKIKKKERIIDIGDAGTDMRFLTALLSVKEGDWILTGSQRMKERPIGELVKALQQLGAEISYEEKQGFPPLKIKRKKLIGGKVEIDGSVSSQFISALLLIAPTLEKGLEINIKNKSVSRSYILMTLDILSQYGIKVSYTIDTISVANLQGEIPNTPLLIESDWSAASYWFSLVALAPNAKITLKGLQKGSSQGDSVLPKIYQNFGVATEFNGSDIILTKTKTDLKYFEYDFIDCPDIAQTIAVTCFALKINCKLTGLSTLKNKETDRLQALKIELEKLGAQVEITDDSLQMTCDGREIKKNKPVIINNYGDHRMAMSFAPLVLILGELQLNNPEVVIKSYPRFWEELKQTGIEIQEA